ncbi:MAG: hypothetical protein ACFFDN_00850 [Candidatus Hodarchaeota archaeon]
MTDEKADTSEIKQEALTNNADEATQITEEKNSDSEQQEVQPQENIAKDVAKHDSRDHRARSHQLRKLKREVQALKGELHKITQNFTANNVPNYYDQMLNQAQSEYEQSLNIQAPSAQPKAERATDTANNELAGYDIDDLEYVKHQAAHITKSHPDLEYKLEEIGCTPHVCIAAAHYSENGLKDLYEMGSIDHFADKIADLADLSPERQKIRIVKLLAEYDRLKYANRKSKATPQPVPIKATGTVPPKTLSIAERRRLMLEEEHSI